MNALKHGLDARTPILPGEDEAAFRARLDAWRTDFPPRTPQEESLIEEAAQLSWQLDRADRVQAASLNERIRLAVEHEAGRPDQDAADAAAIGLRLLLGPNRIGMPSHPDDPDHPERLLRLLESSSAGCRWLLERWAELWLALHGDGDAGWRPDQRLHAVRLLGKQPLDAIDDPMVQRIYLASFVLDANDPQVFADQAGMMTPRDFESFLQRLAGRRVSESVPPDRESARAGLLALVEQVVVELDARAAGHAARADREAASATARLAFDDSAEGHRLRQWQQRLMGSLLRTIDLLMKVRSHPGSRGPHPKTDGNLAASPCEPAVCEKMRNEPTSDPIPDRRASQPDAESIRPDACPESPADTEPAENLATSLCATTACEKIRNEPTAAGPTLPDAPTTGDPGDPASGPDPPSAMPVPPRSRRIRLGPMSGLASAFVGD
jgi:hypothetical protein